MNKPPSNQMQLELPGYSSEGEALMNEARLWVGRNYDAWQWFMREARACCVNGYASVNYLMNGMRNKFHIRIKNDYAPAFARIALEQDKTLKFKNKKSKVDGFTTAVL